MTVLKINAITVPPEGSDELARRFAARAGAVDGQEGFEGFELLRPVDGRDVWLVVTRWRDEESFQAWLTSADFRGAHGGRETELSVKHGHGHGHGHSESGRPAATDGEAAPVGSSAELWSYQVVDLG